MKYKLFDTVRFIFTDFYITQVDGVILKSKKILFFKYYLIAYKCILFSGGMKELLKWVPERNIIGLTRDLRGIGV